MNEQQTTEQTPGYISIKDTAQRLGIKRESVYHYIEKLNLETYTFDLNKNVFLSRADVERIEQIKLLRSTPKVRRKKK